MHKAPLVCIATSMIALASNVAAYPIIDAVVGLPYPELVTVYPDDADPNLFYFVPTTVELVRDTAGKPRLGVQHWGFTGSDPGGLGAALTFSVRPAFDRAKLQEVAKELGKTNPSARWAAMPLVCSRMQVILNGSFFPENQTVSNVQVTPTANLPPAPAPSPSGAASSPPPAASGIGVEVPDVPTLCPITGPRSPVVTRGGTVDSTQAFSVGLSNIGARAFALGVAPDMDVLGAEFTYVFRGVGKRLHARITVSSRRVYEHFKSRASSSSWWGLSRSSWSADWQKLTTDGAIKIDYLLGGASTNADDYMMELFRTLATQKVNGEGMFKPQLQAAGISSPESARRGWGFSAGGGWEKLEEKHTFVFEIKRQALEEREFSTALSFNTVCAKYPDNFADLTTVGKKCIDSTRFGEIAKKVEQCKDNKLLKWKERLDKQLITQTVWEREVAAVEAAPCYD